MRAVLDASTTVTVLPFEPTSRHPGVMVSVTLNAGHRGGTRLDLVLSHEHAAGIAAELVRLAPTAWAAMFKLAAETTEHHVAVAEDQTLSAGARESVHGVHFCPGVPGVHGLHCDGCVGAWTAAEKR